jgi:Fe-S-cluster containining protein
VLAWSSLRRLVLWWQQAVNGFEHTATLPGDRLLVFRCTHFDPATRSCDSYDSRPGICRDYPRHQLHQANPAFLPGCGYRAVARNAAGLKSALARVPMDDDRRAKLEKDLRLE